MSIKVAREIVDLVRRFPLDQFENNHAAVLLEPELRKLLEQAPTGQFRCSLIDENTLRVVCSSAYLKATNHAVNGATLIRTPYSVEPKIPGS